MQQRFPELPFHADQLSTERWHELGDFVNALFAANPLPPGELKRARYPQATQEPLPGDAPRVIGVAGRPRCGKDVVADYLEAHYQKTQRINFSDPIITEINQWLESSGHRITQGNKSNPLYRSLLQAWGMARREQQPDYWTVQLQTRIRSMQETGTELVIVCGVRTPSDLELVEGLGGKCWQVVRPGNDYQARHDIETALDKVEGDRLPQILNPVEGDLAPYEENIRQILSAF